MSGKPRVRDLAWYMSVIGGGIAILGFLGYSSIQDVLSASSRKPAPAHQPNEEEDGRMPLLETGTSPPLQMESQERPRTGR